MQVLAEVSGKPGFRIAAANFAWLVAERGVRFVLGLVVGILVVRHLGPEQLGALSYCLALVALLGCVPSLGIDATLKCELLRQPARAGELIASAWLGRVVTAGVLYLGVLAAAQLRWGVNDLEARLLAITGLLLFQPGLWISELWMQATLRAKSAVVVQLAALAVASALRVWLIVNNAGVTAFAWVLAVEMTLAAGGTGWVARRGGLRSSFRAARWSTLRALVQESWPLLFAGIAVLVYMKIDEVMLRQLVDQTAVGIYAAAVRLSELWYFLPTALASSVLPALVRARENDPAEYRVRLQQYFDVSAAAGYALALPIALVAPWIVRVAYGEKFADAGPILTAHIWSSIFVFLGVARGQWLVNEGLQKFYLAATSAGAVANVALNFALIPRWGGLGAAYATVVSYALAAWLASYFHPAVRATAAMQTRALLIPVRCWRYLRRA